MLNGCWSPLHCPGYSLLLALLINADLPGGSVVKNLPANAGDAGSSLGYANPLEKGMATDSSIPGKSQGQRSLVSYSPQGCKRVRQDGATEHAHINEYK